MITFCKRWRYWNSSSRKMKIPLQSLCYGLVTKQMMGFPILCNPWSATPPPPPPPQKKKKKKKKNTMARYHTESLKFYILIFTVSWIFLRGANWANNLVVGYSNILCCHIIVILFEGDVPGAVLLWHQAIKYVFAELHRMKLIMTVWS